MKLLLVFPLLIPLSTAILCMLTWYNRSLQRSLALLGSGALLVTAIRLLTRVTVHGIQAVQMGAWPAPQGITLVADLFSSVMVLVSAVIGFAVMLYSLAHMDSGRESHGYYPLFNFLMMGVCGSFMTGDLFNMYVWFEVLLTSSFVLIALGGERAQVEGAIKYVTLNLISSALFLAGVGILYGLAGTLNMADLAVKIPQLGKTHLVTACALVFLVAFGIKAAVFPLFFWLPASYHTPPVAVSAIFAGLLTKVGVYALIRVFTLIFVGETSFTHSLILVVSALTMVTGVLGAVAQNEFRRILSFHIISQIGYMIMGLGLYTVAGLAGSIFYIVHHIIVKTNLFLVSGAVERCGGSFELKKLGGIYLKFPLLAALFLIPALSLAGMPPLSGFFAKLSLIQEGLVLKEYLVSGVALVVGFLTLFSMMKIWHEVFWKDAPVGAAPLTARRQESLAGLLFPVALLALLTVYLGVGAEGLFWLSQRAAQQLMHPSEYLAAVLKR
ncbi:MAG: Na+/H+ antiporter subunit D [Candidatus Omnitrophica bacterium]|nr:Na+/H+ antiporter subunit D [Candidatus Omnitrophota bacterium]